MSGAGSLFARIAVLLLAVVFAVLAIGGFTLRRLSIDPGGVQMADLIAGQIAAARVLGAQAGNHASGAAVLDLRHAAAPPAAAEPVLLPFLLRVEQRLQERLGDDVALRVQAAPESRLWVRLPAPERGWVGVAVPPFAQAALATTLTVSISALVLALLAAAWAARRIARPIEQLAAAAPGLSRGEFAETPDLARAPAELRALQRALGDAAAGVRAAARDRELLLAGVSHDLRTPLTRLRLALEMSPPADAGLARQMVQDIEEMDGGIAQFLAFVRDGREEPEREVDLVALLREVLGTAAAAGADWTLDAPGRLPARVRPHALARAVANLVRNAVLHGAAPHRLCASPAPHGALVIAVQDGGAGVEPAELPRLGEPFVRPGRASTRAGSGLGLASARRIAAAHGGTLVLANRPEGGFEAQLHLPRR